MAQCLLSASLRDTFRQEGKGVLGSNFIAAATVDLQTDGLSKKPWSVRAGGRRDLGHRPEPVVLFWGLAKVVPPALRYQTVSRRQKIH